MRRTLFIIGLILGAYSAHAQSDARIFFFRNDPAFPLLGHVTSYGLSTDGKEHHKVAPNSFFLDQVGGASHAWHIRLPWFDWPSNQVDFTTAATPGTITLVAMRQGMLTPSRKVIKKVSLARFEKIYNRNRSLRENMAKAGYNSVADLVKGYKVAE